MSERDRRRSPRVAAESVAHVAIEAPPGETSTLSRLVDLSLEGARLEVDRPIGVGTPLRLGLVLGGELVRSPGRIRWSGPTRSGPRAFAHGVALVDTAWEAREVIRSFLIERLLVGESS